MATLVPNGRGLTYEQIAGMTPQQASQAVNLYGGSNVQGGAGDYSELDSFAGYQGWGTNTIPFDAWKAIATKAGLGKKDKMASDWNISSGAGTNTFRYTEPATTTPASTSTGASVDGSWPEEVKTFFLSQMSAGKTGQEALDLTLATYPNTDGNFNVSPSTPTLSPLNTTTNDDIQANAPAVDLTGVESGITGLGSDISGLNTGLTGIQSGIGDVNTAVTGLGTDIAGVKSDIGNVQSGVGGVQTTADDIQTGVTGLGTAIGTPAEGETVLGNQADLATGQTGIKTSMEDQFSNAQTDRDSQTKKIMDDIQAKYDLTDSQIEKLSTDVLTGQSSLAKDLAQLQTSTDTYYGGLSGTQAEMQDSLGAITGDVSSFRTKYDEDTVQANQRRGQLMNQVAGGFDQATIQRQAIADANATSSSPTTGLSSTTPFAEVAMNLARNIPATTSQGVQSQNEFLASLNNLKQAVSGASPNDPNFTAMSAIADAFDQSGKLIAESVTADGGTIARAITGDGNLTTNVFDTTGMSINNFSLNLDSMLAQFSPNQGLMS